MKKALAILAIFTFVLLALGTARADDVTTLEKGKQRILIHGNVGWPDTGGGNAFWGGYAGYGYFFNESSELLGEVGVYGRSGNNSVAIGVGYNYYFVTNSRTRPFIGVLAGWSSDPSEFMGAGKLGLRHFTSDKFSIDFFYMYQRLFDSDFGIHSINVGISTYF